MAHQITTTPTQEDKYEFGNKEFLKRLYKILKALDAEIVAAGGPRTQEYIDVRAEIVQIVQRIQNA